MVAHVWAGVFDFIDVCNNDWNIIMICLKRDKKNHWDDKKRTAEVTFGKCKDNEVVKNTNQPKEAAQTIQKQ